MKIIPLAVNHFLVELNTGAILDVNDGTPQSGLHIKLEEAYKTRKNQAGVRVYLSAGTRDAFSCELMVYENPDTLVDAVERVKRNLQEL
jgi:hypothetical protein